MILVFNSLVFNSLVFNCGGFSVIGFSVIGFSSRNIRSDGVSFRLSALGGLCPFYVRFYQVFSGYAELCNGFGEAKLPKRQF